MRILVIFFALLFFVLPSTAYATETGLPAFIKINGAFSSLHSLLSQNLIQTEYMSHKPLTFEIDETQLETVIPKEFLTTTTYAWDFGDGTNGEGRQQTHTYKKAGSYIVILTTTVSIDGFATPTQYRESFVMNIIPSKQENRWSKKLLWIVENPLLSK